MSSGVPSQAPPFLMGSIYIHEIWYFLHGGGRSNTHSYLCCEEMDLFMTNLFTYIGIDININSKSIFPLVGIQLNLN